MEMRSHLSRARGLGSNNEGTHHWRWQRITGIALVPLALWFVFSMVSLMGADLATVTSWVGRHENPVMLILLFGVLWPLFHISGRISPSLGFEFSSNFYLFEALARFRFDVVLDLMGHMLMPALALAIPLAAIILQLLKQSLKECMHDDYITRGSRSQSRNNGENCADDKGEAHTRKRACAGTSSL